MKSSQGKLEPPVQVSQNSEKQISKIESSYDTSETQELINDLPS